MPTVDLDDVCNYLISVAANHATRTTRSQHAAAGQSQEQVSFVLRRCVEELQDRYLYGKLRLGPSATPTPNQTYRNRATL